MQRVRDRTLWVEREVQWLKFQTQQDQHKHVVHLLEGAPLRTMSLPLPYRAFPFSQNTQFHFREKLLNSLKHHLESDTLATSLRTVSLFGLGGIGKTQIALEYSYRQKDHYDAIFWIEAETEAKIRHSICTYGRAMLGDNQSGPEDQSLMKTFQRWLITATGQGTRHPPSIPQEWSTTHLSRCDIAARSLATDI